MASVVWRGRNPRWVSALIWVGAAFAFLGGLIAVVHSATFPSAIASHPVRAEATVAESYINGFGGDPGVDYHYWVGGREYSGSATAGLDHAEVSDLRSGDSLAIEYAASDPGESCACDAVREAPESIRTAALSASILSLPLLILVGQRARRGSFASPAWFELVHGFGEWVGFVGGLVVALVIGLIVLAYVLAAAVEP